MNKFVVTIFPNETTAYQGVRALNALDAEGSITLFGTEVVTRDAQGMLSVKQGSDEGPLGTVIGALSGGLIGLLGGPVGAAVGLATGTLLGVAVDFANLGVSASFVDTVSKELTPGKTAVIAEVDEEWVTPLDSRMEALGGTVVREWRADYEDAYFEAQIQARKEELAQLKAEFAQANQERRMKLQAKIEDARARLQEASDRADAWFERRAAELDAKIEAMEARAAEAKAERKASLDRRIAELRAERERRSAKLAQARELAKQAAVLTREAIAA